MKLKNGDVVLGSFQNATPSKTVQYLYANQDYYIGRFVNGFKDGKGTLKEGNSLFEGTFASNKKEGRGTFRKDNQEYSGMFKDD